MRVNLSIAGQHVWARFTRSIWLALLLAGVAIAAHATPAAGTPQGHEADRVVGGDARLSWSRCVEGMAWNGQTCTGKAKLVSHREALALAKARAQAEGTPWRLPSLIEQRHFVVPLLKADKRSGASTLPGAPPGCYWSASVSIHDASVNPYAYKNIQKGLTQADANRLSFLHAWCMDVSTGMGREALRRERLPVRLVTNATP